MLNPFIMKLKINKQILRLEINKKAKIISLKTKIIYKLKQLIFEILIQLLIMSISTPNFKLAMISFIILNNQIITNRMNIFNFKKSNYVRNMKEKVKNKMMKYVITNLLNSK